MLSVKPAELLKMQPVEKLNDVDVSNSNSAETSNEDLSENSSCMTPNGEETTDKDSEVHEERLTISEPFETMDVNSEEIIIEDSSNGDELEKETENYPVAETRSEIPPKESEKVQEPVAQEPFETMIVEPEETIIEDSNTNDSYKQDVKPDQAVVSPEETIFDSRDETLDKECENVDSGLFETMIVAPEETIIEDSSNERNESENVDSELFETMIVAPEETIIEDSLHEDETLKEPLETAKATEDIIENFDTEKVVNAEPASRTEPFETMVVEPEETVIDDSLEAMVESVETLIKDCDVKNEKRVEDKNLETKVKSEDTSQDSEYNMNQEVSDEIVIENVPQIEESLSTKADVRSVKIRPISKRKRKRSQLDQLLDNGKDKSPKRPRNDIVELPKLRGEGDIFCWTCHRPGPFMAVCTICRKIYHATKCSNLNRVVPENWVCYECKTIEEESKLQSCLFDPESLNSLLMMVTEKLENAKDAGPFVTSVDPVKYPDYTEYVHTPMNLFEIKKKIAKNSYENIYSYILDLKTIVHNSYIYNTAISGLTFTARSLLRKGIALLQDMKQCPECFIHAFLCNKKGFVEVCTQVHMPVWAKFKGYPFWPAKLMKIVEPDEYDTETFVQVKFFGDHNRANVPTSNVYLLSEKTPTKWIPKHCSISFKEASDEMDLYIRNLQKKFHDFRFAASYMQFNPNIDLNHQIKVMLPNYSVNQVTKFGDLKLMQTVNRMRKKTYEQEESNKGMGILFARLSDQSPEEFGFSRCSDTSETKATIKIEPDALHQYSRLPSEAVVQTVPKVFKKLSKAEIEALRLNERKKINVQNGIAASLNERRVCFENGLNEYKVMAQSVMDRNLNTMRKYSKLPPQNTNQSQLTKVENSQHSIQVKKLAFIQNRIRKEKDLIKEAFPMGEKSLVQLIRIQKPTQPKNQFSLENSLMQRIKVLKPNSLEKAQVPLNTLKRVDQPRQLIKIRSPNVEALQPIQLVKPKLAQKGPEFQSENRLKPSIQVVKPKPVEKDPAYSGPNALESLLQRPIQLIKPISPDNEPQIQLKNPNSLLKPSFQIQSPNSKIRPIQINRQKQLTPIQIRRPNSVEPPKVNSELKMSSILIPNNEKTAQIHETVTSSEKAQPSMSQINSNHEKAQQPIKASKDIEENKNSENKTVIAVRRDLFPSARQEDSKPPQVVNRNYNMCVKRTTKMIEKRPITFEQFTRLLDQGTTLEQVINNACKGLESLKNHYTGKTIHLTNECAKQIQSIDEDKIKIKKMVDQRFSDKMKRAAKIHEARVKRLQVLYEDRIKQIKMRHWCHVCKRAATIYCCYKYYYCTVQCQNSHWPTHIEECRQRKMVANDPYLSLNPIHRKLANVEKDIKKNDFMDTEATNCTILPLDSGNIIKTNSTNFVPAFHNLVKDNEKKLIGPLQPLIRSGNSEPQISSDSGLPLVAYPQIIGGKKIKPILPKPPNI